MKGRSCAVEASRLDSVTRKGIDVTVRFLSLDIGARPNYAVHFRHCSAFAVGFNQRDYIMQAYLHTKTKRSNGTFDSFQTIGVPVKIKMMPHHVMGLSWSASGYGARIPTVYMVQVNGKWRRVYAICYSNASTLFIGKRYDGSAIVDINL